MGSEELITLLQKVEAKGIDWKKVEEKTKVSQAILKLYAGSGPVPVFIIKELHKLVEEQPQ